MITLKHIAREFELDPYKLRAALRKSDLHPPTNRQWKWPDENHPQYKTARNIALNLSGRSSANSQDPDSK